MASPGGRAHAPLTERLRREYGCFNFYQLVRLLLDEQRTRSVGDTRERRHAPRRRELGRSVRFRADLTAAFPGREITGLAHKPVDGGESVRTELATTNFNVAGYQGPLPETYTEWLRDQVRDGKRGMADFLDIFNHRINVLRCELKSRHRPGLDPRPPENTPRAGYLAALAGLADPDLAHALPIPLRALLGVAGLLADGRRSPPVLVGILSIYLQAPVRLEPLQGDWRRLDESQRLSLGRANCRLGVDSVAGSRVWDAQARVRLVVGPLDYARFRRLLPDGDGHAGLAAMVRYLLDRRFDAELRLLVRTDTLPAAALAGQPRLGHTTWVQGPGRDAADGTRDETRRVDLLMPAFAPEPA
ncbi:MAG TPA: type VI secretion system baseplate subunit TssG [Rhodocyclaceae bacterium]